jgi:flagellar basal-body rod modification protein FlgD
MDIASLTAGSNVEIADPEQTGFGGLTSDTFMRLLITQLQNQDPLEPVGNEELLSQLSMMRNLQANIELGEALQSITTNQQLSTAATYIGREIIGIDTQQATISGIVDRAFLRDGQAFIGIGNREIALANVSAVSAA